MLDVSYYSEIDKGIDAVREIVSSADTSDPVKEWKMMQDDPLQYCQIALRRIAYILAVSYKLELLRCKAEFMKDENDKVWLVFATKILTRPL
jgi:hypothetical protein